MLRELFPPLLVPPRPSRFAGYLRPLLFGELRGSGLGRKAAFLSLVWDTHFVTDSKRWLPNEDWIPGTIINDQALHLATLALLGMMLR